MTATGVRGRPLWCALRVLVGQRSRSGNLHEAEVGLAPRRQSASRPSRSLNRSSSLLESGRQVGRGYRPSLAKGDILCRQPQPGRLSTLGLADCFVQRPAAQKYSLLLGSSGFAPKRNPAVEIWLEFKANTYSWSNLKHLVSVSSLCGSLRVVDVEGPNS